VVETAPRKGTTFMVFLPRSDEAPSQRPLQPPPQATPSSGTILLVEDDGSVRSVVCMILEEAGYRVLATSGPEQALALAADGGTTVDLLLTDVVMPHMSGRELADRLLRQRPGMRVLYTSGYLERPPVLSDLPGALFLQKPFTPRELTEKVAEAFAG
jgi:CheY-like chemotaxis protein